MNLTFAPHRSAFKPSILAIAAAITASAPANMILNGSFEFNSAGTNMINPSNASFNANMSAVYSYGSPGVDILDATSTYGLAPIDGNWKISPFSDTGGVQQEEVAMQLTGPLTVATVYSLSFFAHCDNQFTSGFGPVEIGVSTTNSSFGTLVYTSGLLSNSTWSLFSTTFAAPVAGSYLTVRAKPGSDTWAHIDGFKLVVVPEPTSMAVLGLGIAVLVRRRRA